MVAAYWNSAHIRISKHGSGEEWIETKLLGKSVWQKISKQPVCELSGQPLDRDGLVGAINKEFSQLTKLDVLFGWQMRMKLVHFVINMECS